MFRFCSGFFKIMLVVMFHLLALLCYVLIIATKTYEYFQLFMQSPFFTTLGWISYHGSLTLVYCVLYCMGSLLKFSMFSIWLLSLASFVFTVVLCSCVLFYFILLECVCFIHVCPFLLHYFMNLYFLVVDVMIRTSCGLTILILQCFMVFVMNG